MGKDEVLQCRVSPEKKSAFLALAASSGRKNASDLLRTMVDHVLHSAGLSDSAAAPVPKLSEARTGRLRVSFTEAELQAAAVLAAPFGSIGNWLLALTRRVITRGAPQFTNGEIDVLWASNREIASVGRNLNQIARALNEERKQSGSAASNIPQLEKIEKLRADIQAHIKHVNALVKASNSRWDGVQ